MKNAKRKGNLSKFTLPVLCGMLAVLNIGTLSAAPAKAQTPEAEKRYCADGGDIMYGGVGGEVSASYDVYYDSKVIVQDVRLTSVPSFGNGNTSMPNACAPVAGTNIVGYYDRWYPNLIPNYTPGMISAGSYQYFPDISAAAVKNTIKSLYDKMETNLHRDGTTSQQFFDGLNEYVSEAGYSLSYTSFYTGTTTVDLQKLTTAIDQGKVGLIMCSSYNFVYGISHSKTENKTNVAKVTVDIGHMMTVYGYQTIAYYKNGANFRTDTFLYTCSGFGSSVKGYMQLNDYSEIDEAWIMTIA